MPRRLVKLLVQKLQAQRHKWYLRMFGQHLTDPHLWSLNRRSITTAFGVGIAIAFIPLPVHTVLGALLAIWFGWNLPVILAAAYIVNPFTIVPIYLAAYRVGAWLLREPPRRFKFQMSWQWLEHGLGPSWRPFLFGLLVFAIVFGVIGRVGLEIIWRQVVMRKYHARALTRSSRVK